MADIRRYPFRRHLRTDAVSYIIHTRRARVRHHGPGLAIWFDPMSDSIAEVPIDDRELALVVHARTKDFQDVTVQGIITYRASEPQALAGRIDFTIDLNDGRWRSEPLQKVELMLAQLAQEYALTAIGRTPVRDLLTDGIGSLRDAIETGLRGTAALPELGLDIVTVRIGSIKPSADLEKAIEAPTRESIKQIADEAAYARRALAVEKERAIAENELQNRIELAKREELLIEQQGENAKRQAEDVAEAAKIASDAEAERIHTIESVKARLERERLTAFNASTPAVLLALAAREFAGKIDTIEHLNITPDLLGTLVDEVVRKASA